MDSRIGLDYIVENREYVIKLGTALDTNNVTVKKQVFELLSALCAYNADGYERALETLEHYKNLKQTRYRFKIVVNELDTPNSSAEYQVALLAFVNCIIISTQCLQDRMRIRNEFIGLKILPILTGLRRASGGVADIAVQLDVFDEQRECDEAQSLQEPSGINLSSHLDVFYAILGQVSDTPQEIPFLSILQHLLRIDPKEPISDIIWDTAETLVHRATLLENREDSTRLLRTPSVQKFTCPHCRGDLSSPNRRQSLAPITPVIQRATPFIDSITTAPSTASVPAPPPPPPPMMSTATTPTPSNNKSLSSTLGPPAPPPPAPPSSLLPTSHDINSLSQRPITPDIIDPGKLLPQQETPVPKLRMKTINWNKIASNKLTGKNNIWTMVANSHQDSPMTEMDWNEMEGLFCLKTTSAESSPKMGRDAVSSTGEMSSIGGVERKPRKENSEIVLLDGKRSLNINIVLKQFRTTNEDIIQLIKDGEHDVIGAEKLRGLLKILPEVDEFDMLKAFDGDQQRLGNAEKFLMQLFQVPNYKLRVESMLLKEEFAANLSYLEPSIDAMVCAGYDLMDNSMLREVLYMVVVAGNFLNAGGYAGNAAGVKLSSLQKLTDIRANKPDMNLIHFVALQAEKRNRDLLTFSENLTTLENASKTTVEQINNEINALDAHIEKIKRQIGLPTTELDLKNQMSEFLVVAEKKVEMLQRGIKEVETVRLQLCEFFCEDSNTFKLEECFKIFQSFCDKFKQAVSENERRRFQEEQAMSRRKMREEQLAKRARQSHASTPVSDSDNSLLFDPSQIDMRASPAMPRRRIGSFNSNGDHNRDDGFSPDVTPTGSLRRRRSRVLGEEDDNSLMDFLRSSGHDNGSRERKPSTYGGSLDRSWARRARSGSNSKKRPDLLNIDFGVDRERPISPAPPNTEAINRVVAEEARPRRISREWRQKIESWLQANEQDEKQNDDYKRRARRLAGNRRSFENDSENERSKLDPLPEERAATTTTTTTISSTTTTPSTEPYKRVYPDWKPSTALERTDITANLEAIEDAHLRAKDKAAWRKSNLNVPTSSEEISSRNNLRDSVSCTSISSSNTPLQSIVEEDKRKNQQSTSSDPALKIYVRRPPEVPEYEPVYQKHDSKGPVGITSDQHSIYIRPSATSVPKSASCERYESQTATKRVRCPIEENELATSNKIEIDSDNIETPPAVRRNIAAPRPLHRRTIDGSSDSEKVIGSDTHHQSQAEKASESEILGDGQFDRHSSARRTRRYRRPTDHSSGNEERTDTSPELLPLSDSIYPLSKLQYDTKTTPSEKAHDNSKIVQQPSPTIDANETNDALTNSKSMNILSRVGKLGRNISSINQEAVREAIRNLRSPTDTPERIWSPPREIVVAKDKVLPIKVANHELNDEGFEETQSLVSDTPSHGKESTSSCNDQTDNKNPIRSNVSRVTSSDSTATGLSAEQTSKRRSIPKSSVQTLLERNRQSLERSRSLRSSHTATPPIRSIIPKRTNSLRKSDTNATSSMQHKRDVERSSSRTSLRSSRSSLNSSASTNTVRNMALKSSPASSSRTSSTVADKTNYKKSLTSQNNATTSNSKMPSQSKATNSSSRAPASRSSSSGSSIGPSPRRSNAKSSSSNSVTPPITGSTSILLGSAFKENQTNSAAATPLRPAFRNTVSTSSHSNSSLTSNHSANGLTRTSPSTRLSNLTKGIASKTSNRVSNFMRPTTASATKVSSGNKGK